MYACTETSTFVTTLLDAMQLHHASLWNWVSEHSVVLNCTHCVHNCAFESVEGVSHLGVPPGYRPTVPPNDLTVWARVESLTDCQTSSLPSPTNGRGRVLISSAASHTAFPKNKMDHAANTAAFCRMARPTFCRSPTESE